jgi:hypothetical protein
MMYHLQVTELFNHCHLFWSFWLQFKLTLLIKRFHLFPERILTTTAKWSAATARSATLTWPAWPTSGVSATAS